MENYWNYPLLGIKFVLPSGHGWGIVLLSPGCSLSSIKSWIFWTGKAISWRHVRYVLVYNGHTSSKDWCFVLHEIYLSCSIIHYNALSSQILDFPHKDYCVYCHCKKNINFALGPPISDALANEKRVNYKQLHFSWVTDRMFIQEKQAWTVQSFYKQYFEEKI